MITIGQKVTLKRGKMFGRVLAIRKGPWSNGGIPMATVLWESGETSRVTSTNLKPQKSGE